MQMYSFIINSLLLGSNLFLARPLDLTDPSEIITKEKKRSFSSLQHVIFNIHIQRWIWSRIVWSLLFALKFNIQLPKNMIDNIFKFSYSIFVLIIIYSLKRMSNVVSVFFWKRHDKHSTIFDAFFWWQTYCAGQRSRSFWNASVGSVFGRQCNQSELQVIGIDGHQIAAYFSRILTHQIEMKYKSTNIKSKKKRKK